MIQGMIGKKVGMTRIFRENGAVWAGVFVNGRNSRQLGGLDAILCDGDTVTVVPPISGG